MADVEALIGESGKPTDNTVIMPVPIKFIADATECNTSPVSALAKILSWTYTYTTADLHYSKYPSACITYYQREVRTYDRLYDGWWEQLHSQQEGIPSTRFAQAIVNGVTGSIIDRIDNIGGTPEALEKLQKHTNMEEFIYELQRGFQLSAISGTSLYDINLDKEKEHIDLKSVRSTMFYYEADPLNGNKLSEVEFVRGIRVPSTNRSSSNKKNIYYMVEKRFYRQRETTEIAFNDAGEAYDKKQVEMIPYKQIFVRMSDGNATTAQSFDTAYTDIVDYKKIPDDWKSIISEEEYAKEQILPFDDLGAELMLYDGNDDNVPSLSVGRSILKPIMAYVCFWDIINAYKMRDIYAGKTQIYTPPDLIENSESSNIAYSNLESWLRTTSSNLQKVEVEQAELRVEEWNKALDYLIRQIAFSLGVSTSMFSGITVSTGAGNINYQSATKSKIDDRASELYVKRIITRAKMTINKIFNKICKFLDLPKGSLWIKIKEVNKIDLISQDYLELFRLGIITKEELRDKLLD